MRTSFIGAFTLGLLLAATTARAQESAKPAVVEDKPSRGGLFSIRTSVVVPTGSYADGVSLSDFGPGEAVTATLGYFVTPHIGLLAAARGSYGHSGFSGCKDPTSSSSTCGGYTLQVPLLVELAPSGRTHGFFADVGVGLLTQYKAYGDAGTLAVTSPIEAKLGVGYRWEAGFLSRNKHPGWGFELYANADIGQFSHLTLHSVDGSVDGDIAPEKKSIHTTFDLGVALYWGL
jgi:hypothetical protein